MPLEEAAGALIVQALMSHRVPAVIDLSGFRKAAQRRFATAFIEELYRSNRDPMHVVFDEADQFAPQSPMQEGRHLLGAMEDFVRRGRLRGLGCTLVSQRPVVIHKDVLTQVEVLVTMGLTGPRDVDAIGEWIRLHADEEEARAVRNSLASLPVGTAWVWSPEWLEILQKVRVRRITTFDSFATPKVGSVVKQPTARAQIDLAALGTEIAATAERVKHEDPRALRARIAELERKLAASSTVTPAAPAPVEVQVPVITDADRREFTAMIDRFLQLLIEGRQATADLAATVASGEELAARLRSVVASPPPVMHLGSGARSPQTRGQQRPEPAKPRPERIPAPVPAEGEVRLAKMEKVIAGTLATHGTLSARQIGLLTGYA